MVIFDYAFNPTTIIVVTVKVVIILVIAITLNIIQKKMIPRIIIASIPTIRVESQDQLSSRSKTMASVLTKTKAIILWVIAFMMVLGVIEIDTAPLLATLGIASLALGFAV